MSWLITLLRRALWLAVLGALGGAAFSWWRSRTAPPAPAAPQWPPLATTAPDHGATTPSEGTAPAPETPPAEVADAVPGSAAGDAAEAAPPIASLVDTVDATPSGNGGAPWTEPNEDGSCPASHPIKANDNSRIFHVPGGQFYDRTRAERCYANADAATTDGYRKAKA